MVLRELESLRLLIVDRYTAPEVVERLNITTDELLDNYLEEVYSNLERFDEIVQDFINDTGEEEDEEDFKDSVTD